MPSAQGAKQSTARPAVDANGAISLAIPPLKKLKQEGSVLETSEQLGNLAMEDDFFLEADTADISDALPMPLLVDISRL